MRFALGCNFDPALPALIGQVNAMPHPLGQIAEVYGALQTGAVGSARLRQKLPALTLAELADQVASWRSHNIGFNYLLNARNAIAGPALHRQLDELAEAGIQRLTVGTPELAAEIKSARASFDVVLSLVYRTRTPQQLLAGIAAGVSAVYLDAVTVNRDFSLLRRLRKRSTVPVYLYANVSCISRCPVIDAHYGAFSGSADDKAAAANFRFNLGCSAVKARNPLEWIQAPWIRPEDVEIYAQEGIQQLKLSDRLASTGALLEIATAYVRGRSPSNLFSLMERDGDKFRSVWSDPKEARVSAAHIPRRFVEHFREGVCTSSNIHCRICNDITAAAINENGFWPEIAGHAQLEQMPRALRLRTEQYEKIST